MKPIFSQFKLALVLIFLSATTSIGQPLMLEPCDAYAEMLSGELNELTEEEFDECILYEQIILTSPSWAEFILRFRAHISEMGYPVLLFTAIKENEQGHTALAFTKADAALLSIAEIFISSGDDERARYYIPLIMDFRNSLLEGLGVSTDIATSIRQEYSSLSSLIVGRPNVEQTVFIQCLIGTDSFTVPLNIVLESNAFLDCIEQ